MAQYILRQEDIEPLLQGLTLYGTGGGGESSWGRTILENEFAQGRVCRLVKPDEVPDDALICSGGIMGSVKALEAVTYEDLTAEWEREFPLVNAIHTMARLCGRKVDYLIPFEVGALNTPVILSAAARLGIPMIDGDGNGRSAPETQMTSFIGHGISLYPMPLSDRYGNTTIVLQANEVTYADEVGRFIVVKGGGLGANAHYPMSGTQMKRACVQETVSDALCLGRKMEACRKKGEDPVALFCSHFNGRVLFSGAVRTVQGEDKGGFYLTNLLIQGRDPFAGQEAKLIIKNETMALWVDGVLRIQFPDRAFMLDPVTGEGIPSVALESGTRLTIVGAPCHPRIRACMDTREGQVSFDGARYGFGDLVYTPFEQLS